MKISLHWLQKYVPVQLNIDLLASLLTNGGLEVEAVEYQEKELENFVVGKVLTCEKHPKADKLTLCTVDTGPDVASVICGAPNVAAGQHVIFAKVGAVVPKGGFTIEKKKIRGIESSGMICSAAELNLSDDHSGIMILPETTVIGQTASDYFHRTDIIFEIGITPNRVDALSHIGVARDIAALTNRAFELPGISNRIIRSASRPFVQIEIPKLCPRYSAMIIRGIEVKDSPEWLKRNLESVGIRSINNIVDVTNFVMYEIGHPMHAFDFDKVEDGKIIVRSSKKGEKFVTLDGKVRSLEEQTILICDGAKPVAIGGVMGGANSEISHDTKNILLESAYFNPSSIRRTSKFLGLSTDSSYRFERGADPNVTMWALQRAAQLIVETAGGSADSMCDIYPETIHAKQVLLRPDRVNKILGIEIDFTSMKSILVSLGIGAKEKDNMLLCSIPTYRPDIEREIDLIEEIARIYGYDKIPTPDSIRIATGNRYDDDAFIQEVRNKCIALGLFEIQSSSLIELKKASLFAPETVVTVQNPVSAERPALRPGIVPSLLECIDVNIRNGNTDLRIFEIGSVFQLKDKLKLSTDNHDSYSQDKALGVALSGTCSGKSWHSKEREYDFFDLKGICEALFESLHLDNFTLICYDTPETLSNSKLAVEIEGVYVGYLSEITKEICTTYDIRQRVFIMELFLDNIDSKRVIQQKYTAIPHFPTVKRDLAFVIDQSITSQEIIKYILGMNVLYVSDVQIVDLFESEVLGAGKKSLAFSLSLKAADHTLTDSEINVSVEKIINQITLKFKATLRSS